MSVQPVKKGDFVELSFEGRLASGGEVFEKAQRPILAIVGEGQLVPGLDSALVGAMPGEEKSVEIDDPAMAFGVRTEELVRLVPAEQFTKQGVTPVAGMQVELDGATARIQSVSGGRVRVDFNHPLAGKKIAYSFKVEKSFLTPEEKVSALAKNFLSGSPAKFEAGVAAATAGEGVRKDAEYTIGKMRFVSLALKFVPEVKRVTVLEEYAATEGKAATEGMAAAEGTPGQ
ncbi:peptidylprolyl isomerase [Candidatus Micrarchaeota archaeon]|nr:peptidylprolyl isomerase [Candidatus Micrarchaeota archaeon]